MTGRVRQTKYSGGGGSSRLSTIVGAGLVNNIPKSIQTEVAELIHASLAASTWEKYESAWAALRDYEIFTRRPLQWPLALETMRGYAAYLFRVRKLKTTSIKTYLSALACLHRLKGYPNHAVEDDVMKAIMRGAENLQMTAPQLKPNCRRVMTVSLLKHLGHRLATSGWEKPATQSVWAASLAAFFGTARMGELLSPSESWADPTCTFTWSCVQYRQETNSFLLHIRLAKMRSPQGEFIDLFPFHMIPGLCPVAALKKQWERQRSLGRGRPEDPVFTYPSGNYVTTEAFNKALRILLEDVVDYKKDSITCHSFRAGLPSLISQYPELMSVEDIKSWGRWSGESYAKYTRLGDVQKKKLFDMISDVIAR